MNLLIEFIKISKDFKVKAKRRPSGKEFIELKKICGRHQTTRTTRLLHEKFLQFDWLRAVVFQLNLKYPHVKITNLLRVVV